MQRGQWVVAGAALAVALAAGAWFGARPEAPPPISLSEPAAAPAGSSAGLTVHVSGAVVRPGLVVLPVGARVADALAAAGGAAPDADLASLNLAAPVADGTQVGVPYRGATPAGPGTAPSGPLSLNRATVADLEALPGVGPVTAARIVAHRDQHGPFTVVEDLLDVPGIGEGKLAALRELVMVP